MCFSKLSQGFRSGRPLITIQKLKTYKTNKLTLSWFESYLSQRTQLVNINTNQSKTENVLCCVPQGSILGPLLLFIFINDLHLFIGDSIRSVDLYTEDTTIYDIGLDKDTLENNL